MPKTEPAAAIWLHVDELTPWKFNPRHNDHAVERVAKNIEALGFGSPIVARTLPDGKREIIAGHTRLKAMKWLSANRGSDFTAAGTPGPGMVPVRILEHLTDDQAAALAIADNKLSEMSAWDDNLLIELLRALDDGQKQNTGFSENEMEILLAQYDQPIIDERKLKPVKEIVDEGTERVIAHVHISDVGRAREIVEESLRAAGIDVDIE